MGEFWHMDKERLFGEEAPAAIARWSSLLPRSRAPTEVSNGSRRSRSKILKADVKGSWHGGGHGHWFSSANVMSNSTAMEPFLYAHAPFPLFSTQPPPAAPTVQVPPSSSSGFGRRNRVATTPEAGNDANKRMYYTHEEDLKLVSTWLNNSTDPIEGNARKGETYWTKVAKAFNATTPDERKREVSHLKGHWHKTTKNISFFNGCYI
ncbi:hypothetical protein E2562_034243 [Oryza meyeriana var. granulata]|uniref:Myb-like domain-containing protein n=1 Tax=Oryza meyeriana var. granulata TaxID=110450 RepID=A0A6G1CAK7_9ORYZ|nr:hypothetical protein E2562_034243 [Oryza meyeriana var. granulata]